MVIQDDSEVPIEVSVVKTPHTMNSEATKYVIVKNHVRELPVPDQGSSEHKSTQDESSGSEKQPTKTIKVKPTKNKEITPNNEPKSLPEINETIEKAFQGFEQTILKRLDRLEEILRRITEPQPSTSSHNYLDSNAEEYTCVNKKIIFDEDGKQVVVEPSENQMHFKKLKRKHSVPQDVDIHSLVMGESTSATKNLAVEYEEDKTVLPSDLVSLSNILEDSKIAVSYRNEVINKVKSMKQDYVNEIKYNKRMLIEKLKSNTDSANIFEFQGANLFTLPGYPNWK